MTKAIATISGVALAPGISRNGRLYTKETISRMVARAQERIAAGKRPIAMYTSHDSTATTDIGGVLTQMWVGKDDAAHYLADVPDTPTGRTIAALVDPSGGRQFLRGVSVLGNWVGAVRHKRVGGEMVETGNDFELGRLDFTSTPAVRGAGIDGFKDASEDGENDGGYTVSESAPEALVTTATEENPAQPVAESVNPGSHAVPAAVREALAVFLGPVAEAGDATPPVSKRGSGMTGGGRKWADPGYQPDKKQRYDITTKAKALAAWRFIHQPAKAAKYSSAQLKQIRSRIRAALKGFGVTVSTESAPGWGFEAPYQVTEAVAEWFGDDPKRSGSWCVSASNGPVNLSLSSYSMDPADLDVIIRAAADAACKALAALDPDMDGDVDVAGAGSSDTDHDGGNGETAANDPATAGDSAPAPAGTKEETEDPAMAETDSTTDTGSAAESGLTLNDIRKAVTEASAAAAQAVLEADRKERADRKAARKNAAGGTGAAGSSTQPAIPGEGEPVTETDKIKAAVAEALAAAGIKPAPAQEADPVKAAVAEALKAAGITPEPAVTEEDQIAQKVREQIQALVADGSVTVQRAGIITEHVAPTPDTAKTPEDLAKMSEDDWLQYAGSALDVHLGNNSKRIDAVHA